MQIIVIKNTVFYKKSVASESPRCRLSFTTEMSSGASMPVPVSTWQTAESRLKDQYYIIVNHFYFLNRKLFREIYENISIIQQILIFYLIFFPPCFAVFNSLQVFLITQIFKHRDQFLIPGFNFF